MQSKTDSLMESLTNVVIGFSINFVANVLVLPAVLGIPVNLKELGLIGIIFTVISVVRSYTLRRLFNGRSVWQAIKDSLGRATEDAITRAERDFDTALDRAQQARLRVEQLIERP